jgi:hypothetical protein
MLVRLPESRIGRLTSRVQDRLHRQYSLAFARVRVIRDAFDLEEQRSTCAPEITSELIVPGGMERSFEIHKEDDRLRWSMPALKALNCRRYTPVLIRGRS